MSIDINWVGLTTGPEGLALAGSIRDFIHDKFQQVQLPRFIRSVEVHSFDFGPECPVVTLKDICDPLSEFYEADEKGSEDDEGEEGEENGTGNGSSIGDVKGDTRKDPAHYNTFRQPALSQSSNRPSPLDFRLAHHPSHLQPNLSRSSTPGIPGGTSNLSYFHLPLSGALSGTQTPLAAVAGGGAALNSHWPDAHIPSLHAHPPYAHIRAHSPVRQQHPTSHSRPSYADPSNRPSTSGSFAPHTPDEDKPNTPSESTKRIEPSPTDFQIVLHTTYTGTLSLSLTAEILLDYPMPSFVGIPLKLHITGLSFDGVALIAYVQNKAHFCFLGPEDARTLVGEEENVGDSEEVKGAVKPDRAEMGGLLREIRVESTIGRQENGKQVLRNVGKVEGFVLEQVRRIFEEEFVWPSYWTFLV
ncbi:MAG: hypothetical protein Q9223_006316 [Gallowayella weberi]